jgi:hypothetical protein
LESVLGATPHEFESRILRQCLTGHDVVGPRRKVGPYVIVSALVVLVFGYPQIRLLALVSCGTHTLIDAVFGPTASGETAYAPRSARVRVRPVDCEITVTAAGAAYPCSQEFWTQSTSTP